jgi:tRNA(Ile)-lysidine synthase
LFLGEELLGFGFASETIVDIEKSLFSQPGKVFHSPIFLLVRDRDYLILSPKNPTNLATITIDENTKKIDSPIQLKIENTINSESFSIPKNPLDGAIDFDKLSFPITLRPWHHGDWFIPLGMKGKKKISDFLVDQKVPIHLKEQIYVLESNNLIAWVVGYRIDDRFKITANTKKVWIGRIEKYD